MPDMPKQNTEMWKVLDQALRLLMAIQNQILKFC